MKFTISHHKIFKLTALENVRLIEKGPERINDVIDKNFKSTTLIDPKDIDINIVDPKHSLMRMK